MGKISDAIDKHKAEKQVSKPVERDFMPQRIKTEEPEVTFAKEYLKEQRYSDKLVTILAPNSVTAETFKVIRGTILYDKDRPAPKAIMVTSTFPGEGKTFVSANLAVSFAMGLNENVLLVDADLRRPAIHTIFGYANKSGLSEHLQDGKTIPELLIKTKIKKLTLLLSGKPPSNPVELLSSKKMEEFVKEAKDRYQDRFIIMDVPPSQLTAETNVIANHVDGIILVVMNGKTPRNAIQQTIESLGKEKILGIIFNGFAQSYKSYNKYYRKYYQ
jgi:protein-tyrosine kinase